MAHLRTDESSSTRHFSSSSPDVAARKIYTELLSRKGYGHALWDPEPRDFEVEIGDVGFLDNRDGFTPIFNVLKPVDDPKNAGCFPEHFEELRFSRRSLLTSNPLPRNLVGDYQHIERGIKM